MSANDTYVRDEVNLYRLVHPEKGIVWDDDEQRWKVKSSEFQNTTRPVKTDRMSVILGDTLAAWGRPPEDARKTKPTWYVVVLTAQFVRAEDQDIERDPKEDEPAHGNVVGDKRPPRRRRFAAAAAWIVEPQQLA